MKEIMMLIEHGTAAAVLALGAWLTYVFKKVNVLDDKLDKAITESQVRVLINDRIEILNYKIENLHADSKRVEAKLDILIDRLVK